MKVRVSVTMNASKEFRRALRNRYFRDGLATRDECRRWWIMNIDDADSDLIHRYGQLEGEANVESIGGVT
jgi:hypothetical protein